MKTEVFSGLQIFLLDQFITALTDRSVIQMLVTILLWLAARKLHQWWLDRGCPFSDAAAIGSSDLWKKGVKDRVSG